MIKKMYVRKILVSTAVLFALFLVYLVPNETNYSLKDIPQKLVYVNKNIETSNIYLYDSNNYLAKTEVIINSKSRDNLIKEIVNILIKGGEGNDKILSA